MTTTIRYIFFILGFLGIMAGCAGSRGIRIESEPAGARVFIDEKEIGVAPLDLTESAHGEAFKSLYLNIRVSKPEFETRLIAVPTSGLNTFKVELQPLDSKYFENTMMQSFQRPQNALVRDLLQIQGLLFVKKNEEAKTRLNIFIKKYPNIAASFVLLANLELASGNQEQAILNLQRALSLDPEDAVIKRMLENLNGRARQ